MNRLTILAGENGSGKSSVIQSILLLRRVYDKFSQLNSTSKIFSENRLFVDLNNNFFSFGKVGNVSCQSSMSNEIGITFTDIFGKYFNALLTVDESYELGLRLVNLNSSGINLINQNEFYYLNAERNGPRLVQNIKHQKYLNVGIKGEFTAQILGDTESAYGFKVDELRCFDSKNPRLISQVNIWLDYILPGVEVTANYNQDTLSAQILLNNSYSKLSPVLSTNIGFGISYVLPIILQCLIAKNQSLVIIENPEAHLHPSAQSRLGKFLSKMANAGVNLLIETHSDHIINGIQLSVLDKDIDENLININFFSNDDRNQPNIKEIKISNLGELSEWPDGFFDQSQLDLREIFIKRINLNEKS